jgi:hypothetical protein
MFENSKLNNPLTGKAVWECIKSNNTSALNEILTKHALKQDVLETIIEEINKQYKNKANDFLCSKMIAYVLKFDEHVNTVLSKIDRSILYAALRNPESDLYIDKIKDFLLEDVNSCLLLLDKVPQPQNPAFAVIYYGGQLSALPSIK